MATYVDLVDFLGAEGVLVGAVEAHRQGDFVPDVIDDVAVAVDGHDVGAGFGKHGGKSSTEQAQADNGESFHITTLSRPLRRGKYT